MYLNPDAILYILFFNGLNLRDRYTINENNCEWPKLPLRQSFILANVYG